MIDVYNYNQSIVCVKASNYSYLFPSADEYDNPSVIPVPYRDVEFINQTTKAFKEGLLRFGEDEQEELYQNLRITDWENIFTRDSIINIIINPTVDDLETIVNIKSLGIIEKFRGELYRLINTGEHDISVRLQQIINARYDELLANKTQSEIQIRSSSTPTNTKDKQIAEMQAEMEKLRELVMKLSVDKVDTPTVATEPIAETTTAKTTKRKTTKNTKE